MSRRILAVAALGLAGAGIRPALAASPEGAPEASAADDEGETPAGSDLAGLTWHDAHAHVVRLDIGLGRWTGRDLGAGGLALQWEWWPTETLAFGTRTWLQQIRAPAPFPDDPDSERQTTGASVFAQIGTPGPVKLVAGAGAGIAFVHGELPPSERWGPRPIPVAGVVHAHAGLVMLAGPVTLHALGQVHVYSEGPPVLGIGIGGGPVVRPQRRAARRAEGGLR
jgi:hypothetical protein